METIRLTSDNKTLIFQRIALTFHEQGIIDAFAHKNNKTLLETVSGRRYKHLSQLVSEKHEAYLQSGLGEFLLELKLSGDSLYERFLNPYGDEIIVDLLLKNIWIVKAFTVLRLIIALSMLAVC